MTLEAHISFLTSRLRPEADEINAVSVDEGWCRSAGVPIPYPTREEFETEWALLEAELSAPPDAETTIAELQMEIGILREAILDLLLAIANPQMME